MAGRSRMRIKGGGGGGWMLSSYLGGLGSQVEPMTPEEVAAKGGTGPMFKPKNKFLNVFAGGAGSANANSLNTQSLLNEYDRAKDFKARIGLAQEEGLIRSRLEQDESARRIEEIRTKNRLEQEAAEKKASYEFSLGLQTQAQKTLDEASLKQEQNRLDIEKLKKEHDLKAQMADKTHQQELAQQNNQSRNTVLSGAGVIPTEDSAASYIAENNPLALRASKFKLMNDPVKLQNEINASQFLQVPETGGLFDVRSRSFAVKPGGSGGAMGMLEKMNSGGTGMMENQSAPSQGLIDLGNGVMVRPKSATVPTPTPPTPGVQQRVTDEELGKFLRMIRGE